VRGSTLTPIGPPVAPTEPDRVFNRGTIIEAMTTPLLGTSTLVDERTEERELQDPGSVAHIVKDPGKVTEAYILGTPVEALCGHVFTPSKDPKQLPICDTCKDIADIRTDGKGGEIS